MNAELAKKYLSTPTGSAGVVQVPGWGEVHVRALSVADLERIRDVEEQDAIKGLLLLIALGVGDESGGLVFDPDNLDALKGISAPALKLLGEGVAKANMLSPQAVDDAKKG